MEDSPQGRYAAVVFFSTAKLSTELFNLFYVGKQIVSGYPDNPQIILTRYGINKQTGALKDDDIERTR